jgi:hypothetical protein
MWTHFTVDQQSSDYIKTLKINLSCAWKFVSPEEQTTYVVEYVYGCISCYLSCTEPICSSISISGLVKNISHFFKKNTYIYKFLVISDTYMWLNPYPTNVIYIYMELPVKPEILKLYIYLRLATQKAISFYWLHNVSKLNQLKKFSCVTVVCKHFASYQDYPN